MKAQISRASEQEKKLKNFRWHEHAALIAAAVLLLSASAMASGQSAPVAPPANPGATAQTSPAQGKEKKTTTTSASTGKAPSNSAKRKAVKLYLKAAKLYEQARFEEAEKLDEQAAELDPTNANYPLAAELARSHAVTSLVQKAAEDKTRGNEGTAREELARALELDPKNPIAAQHLNDIAGDVTRGEVLPLYIDAGNQIGPNIELLPNNEKHSFHLKKNSREIMTEVFKAYGVQVLMDDTMRSQNIRFDIDDVDFLTATKMLGTITQSFYTPIDAHRVLIARDNTDQRALYLRQQVETIYLAGLNDKDRTEVQTIAKSLFDLPQAALDAGAGTLTVKALPTTLEAFNLTLRQMLQGRNQVVIEVRMIQLARMSTRNTGATLPQQMSVFNVGIEETNLLNQNAALVQQIISSGLASANDPLAILAILLASGQVTDPILQSLTNGGTGIFGGGSSTTGITGLTTTVNLNLNSSESRELDAVTLRLGDDEKGTIKTGVRYPITTSSFSSSLGSTSSIPGLTSAGVSSTLSSLGLSGLSGLASAPMIEYQDIGLTLTTTPRILRDGDVALNLDLKLTSLAGQSVNGVPVLNNRAYTGLVTLKDGEGVVLVSDIDKEETRSLSGEPVITEIPGLNNATSVDKTKNSSTLLIVLTPHVVRWTQTVGHSPILILDRKQK